MVEPGHRRHRQLLGGIALLLWGVRMVRTGVMRAWGDRLKNFIEHRSETASRPSSRVVSPPPSSAPARR
jgi:hypothetical protein